MLPLAAIAKYGKGQATDDLPTAVAMLVERNILPNLVPGAMLSSNAFRTERLYHEEVSSCPRACAHTHTHMCCGCGAGCRPVSLIRLTAYRSSRQSTARQGKAGEWQVGDSGHCR